MIEWSSAQSKHNECSQPDVVDLHWKLQSASRRNDGRRLYQSMLMASKMVAQPRRLQICLSHVEDIPLWGTANLCLAQRAIPTSNQPEVWQDRWKVCPQAHNLRAASPSCNSQMQMGQSSPQQASEPSAPTVKTPGSARMRSAGRPTVCCRDMVPSAAVRLETCPHRDNASASSTKRSWPSERRNRHSRAMATAASPKWSATQTKHKTCHVNKYKYSDSSGRHLGVCAWTSASQKEPRRDQKAKAGTMINHVSQNNA
eukprot:CAMPEP_0115415334 /NCGR_PEP_ID=MMETSP0271-20121206/23044_1 /TAXON_ID=71861 /ORGANISM="Scrippsiella trochoidea, Strain CCMP3099" /LENGTH=256 /DNA_ID=CAMNT_0002839665 /DNA_START=192 /DNA_END=963 /DNA_ORIENTATION=+